MNEFHDLPPVTGHERPHTPRKLSEGAIRRRAVLDRMDAEGSSSPDKRKRGSILVPGAMAVASLLVLSPGARETTVDVFKGIGERIDNNYDLHNGPNTGVDNNGNPIFIEQPESNGNTTQTTTPTP